MPDPVRTTPMLEQYWSLKREVPDAILFYRLGDFYEMFFEDAETAAPLLGLVLTARHRDSDVEAPMCGVPFHQLDTYVARLVAAGKKVAISEQSDVPLKGKALATRRVVRVVTPGTIVDLDRLDGKRASELAAVARVGGEAALSFLDLTTGDFSVILLTNGSGPAEWLTRRQPREVVCFASEREEIARWVAAHPGGPPVVSELPDGAPRGERAQQLLLTHFKTASLAPFGLRASGPEVDAAAALLHYARTTQRSECAHVASLRTESSEDGLHVDEVTAGHLELYRSLRDGSRAGTLLELLDRTETSFGARALRRLLERPLGRRAAIETRLDALEELAEDPVRLSRLAQALKGIPDLPRLLARLSVGAGTPRDLFGLAEGVLRSAEVAGLLERPRCELLREEGAASPHAFPSLAAEKVRRLLVPSDVPAGSREGGLFRDGVDGEVDELRRLRRESAAILGSLEAGERAARGIANLRVKFNNVVGHVYEVPASARGKIPEAALKRQTLASVERYATPELMAIDEKLRSADARLCEREHQLFVQLVAEVIAEAPALLGAIGRLALLDALLALARVARAAGWTRPQLVDEPVLLVSEGRHPVVEALRPRDPFVPNDAALGQEQRVVILTGPNMGGKSTYLRQNALLVLLAHVGSYVPAARATVGLCDRIFTRVGASDSLVRGESTFLVEMAETAHILRHATRRSLVVLDEIGRGTSTFDGLSLAWAIAERLVDGEAGEGGPARVLFATHYHELTELALVKPAVANRTMSVKEWNGEVVFLRKVVDGVADRSYGVQVARLAGIPEGVLARAREILHNLERHQLDVAGRPRLAEHLGEALPQQVQLDLFRGQGEVVLDAIGKLEIDRMTPLAALQLLATLQDRLRGGG